MWIATIRSRNLDDEPKQMLSTNSSKCSGPMNRTPKHSDILSHRIASFLRAHYQQDIDLDALSASLHCSKTHLIRCFKRTTQTTRKRWLLSFRLSLAKDVLENQPMTSLIDLAMDHGFSSYSHFSREFKKHFGFSPSAYARNFQVVNERNVNSHQASAAYSG